MCKFVDTHAHIYSIYYDSIDEEIKKALDSGIDIIINAGCDIESNVEVINLTEQYECMYGAIGIHPEAVDSYKKSDLEFIEKNINLKKIVAIGEIGLDYHYTKDNKEKQIALFEEQLRLAEKYNMPVVIHSREATMDTINTLKKYKVKGVIHSFSGSLETAKIYIDMGFYLGINGVVTFKNSNLKDVIKQLSINRIVLETDSPYLTPEPFRGKKNSSNNIRIIAEYLSKIYDLDIEEISNITNKNVSDVFDKLK